MNIDFSAEPLFSSYAIMLILTGIGTLVFAATGLSSEPVRTRLGAVALALAMFGYGAYLAFIFDGGTYHVFWQVFLAPVVLVAAVVSKLSERRKAVTAARDARAAQARAELEARRAGQAQAAEAVAAAQPAQAPLG